MGHYIANVRDIEFNLFEVLGLGSVLEAGGYGDLDSEDDGTGRSPGNGENPALGAVVYYSLKEAPPEGKEVKLELLGPDGQVIRTFSSLAKKKDENAGKSKEEERATAERTDAERSDTEGDDALEAIVVEFLDAL